MLKQFLLSNSGLILTLLLIAQSVFGDFEVDGVSIVGCKQTPMNFFVTLNSEMDILDQYLNQFEPNRQKEITDEHLNRHFKYLIGLSKKYKSENISKFVISSYKKNLKVLSQQSKGITLPVLDQFWSTNVNLGSHPYVTYLQNYSGKKVFVKRLAYQVELMISSCSEGAEGTAFEKLSAEIAQLPTPRDPFLGYWINPASERSQINLSPERQGLIPNCLSADLLIYDTTPEYAWYYWQLGGENVNKKCAAIHRDLTVHFKLHRLDPAKPLDVSSHTFPENTSPIEISLIFGQAAKGHFENAPIYNDHFANTLIKAFDYCSDKKSPVCLSFWDKTFNFRQTKFEGTQMALIFFSKYLNTFLKINSIRKISSGNAYLLFDIEAVSKASGQKIKLKIYNGHTGLGKNYLAPPQYWSFLNDSLYSSDLVGYYGHSSAGQNLKMQTIESQIKTNSNFKKRTKDLIVGFFNCESQSYYGYDFEKIFSLKNNAHLYLLASTGVEAKPQYILALLENFLKTRGRGKKLELSNDLVQTNDFLVFQKIRFF